MPCFHPRQAYEKQWPASGITFDGRKGGRGITVPCGQCIGCRLAKADDWKTRLVHEASRHDLSAFVTLTYADDYLPDDYSVSVRAMQLFMKRLRKRAGKQIRFFACGEYGSGALRPHYHLVLFGYWPGDAMPWRKTGSGHITYRSSELEKLWPLGFSEFGTVTPDSAGYVARYCLKKVNGKAADDHYSRVHPITGELVKVKPEFITMSTKPGLGAHWFAEFGDDAFPSDFLIVEGRKVGVPRYYSKKIHEADLHDVKVKREAAAALHLDNNTPDRLAVRETLAEMKAQRLTREMEQDT